MEINSKTVRPGFAWIRSARHGSQRHATTIVSIREVTANGFFFVYLVNPSGAKEHFYFTEINLYQNIPLPANA